MDTEPLHFDRIPIERHWGLSILLHKALGHTEPWEICEAGCDRLASEAIHEIFGVSGLEATEVPTERAVWVAGVQHGIDATLGMVATAYSIEHAERLRDTAIAYGEMLKNNDPNAR